VHVCMWLSSCVCVCVHMLLCVSACGCVCACVHACVVVRVCMLLSVCMPVCVCLPACLPVYHAAAPRRSSSSSLRRTFPSRASSPPGSILLSGVWEGNQKLFRERAVFYTAKRKALAPDANHQQSSAHSNLQNRHAGFSAHDHIQPQ
jgi:hypothetical protein